MWKLRGDKMTYFYQVTASALNIRTRPTTNSDILGKYLKNDYINVLSEYRGWYKTDRGWVSGDYVKLIKSDKREPIKKVQVFVPRLKIRPYPNHITPKNNAFGGALHPNHEKAIKTYPEGDIVDVYDEEDGWFRTSKGWIDGRYVRILEVYSPVIKAEYEYIVDHIPFSQKRRPGKQYARYNFSFQGITVHNTSNPRSNALDERGWLINPSNTRVASWHIAVDEFRAVEAIPLNEISWNAGDFTGNNTTIGIEICEPNHAKAMENAIHLTAQILKEQNWKVDRLYTHQYWSGKYCPNIILKNGLWLEYKHRVQELL